jgi:AraC-like DNA-binding protein
MARPCRDTRPTITRMARTAGRRHRPIGLFQRRNSTAGVIPDTLVSPQTRQLAARALGIITSKYSTRLTRASIARACACSRSALDDAMKCTDATVYGWLTAIRLSRALAATMESDLKIESIALSVGYRSKKDLYRQCARHLGVTLGMVRRQGRPLPSNPTQQRQRVP